MRERRVRGFQGPSASLVGIKPYEQSEDDWLGEVSDDDWSEDAARRRAAPAYQDLPSSPAGRGRQDAVGPEPEYDVDAADAYREVIERRRLVAGLVVVVVLAIAVAVPVLLLRGGEPKTVTPVFEPATTTTVPSETSTTPSTSDGTGTSTTPATPSTGGTTPTSPTTPSASDAAGFTLPEGTKLRRGEENDPAVVRALQQALAAAGYDPGPADGTYGAKTEAAVVAFQQDNNLSADGVVGPATAAALNGAESTGGSTAAGAGTAFSLPAGTKLRRGEEADPAVVRALQQALAAVGYDPGAADGTYGEKTEAAVTAFQQDNDLAADGVVGAETATALANALSRG